MLEYQDASSYIELSDCMGWHHVHRQPLIQQLYCTFRCNDDLWTQLIFIFYSTVVPFPPNLWIFNSPVRVSFRIKRRIWLFQLVNLLRFRKFKMLGVAASDSLFLFVAPGSFSKSLLLSLSLHPSGATDPNRLRDSREQLLTFFSISISIRIIVIANASYTNFTCWNQPGYDSKARGCQGYFVEALAALLQYDAGHSNRREISQLDHAQSGCIWFTVTRPRARSILGLMTVNQIHPSWAWYNCNIQNAFTL